MKKRFLVAILMIGLYGIIYLLNYLFFDVYKQYYLYTVSWTTRQVLPVVIFITVCMILSGKWYLTSFISFAGYILGIIFGEAFGAFERDVSPQYLHHGWKIWGFIFILSVLVGVNLERVYNRKYLK
ncbi:hypothetical protein [Anaerocolumna sp. MB42-C2]|uniref:hypothetical protein n=1 Tax=Anaerocolumna sp. MB42-C2 TaxID=3070997 RepID=UPI0027DF414A|nr:hypothetical protein [Anaerocolumna sp. MB42-C2]WMJ87160.1 hypothetical protein RBU59_24480 [Anaerocolumna sp. MB42-C2]